MGEGADLRQVSFIAAWTAEMIAVRAARMAEGFMVLGLVCAGGLRGGGWIKVLVRDVQCVFPVE